MIDLCHLKNVSVSFKVSFCLRYANRAKDIKNKPKINEDPKDALLREFQEEIARCHNLRSITTKNINCSFSLQTKVSLDSKRKERNQKT